jgi:hypothetical protein
VTTSLSEHDAIRQVVARYARGVDRLDAEVMKSAYWPEATDDHGVFVGNATVFVNASLRHTSDLPARCTAT